MEPQQPTNQNMGFGPGVPDQPLPPPVMPTPPSAGAPRKRKKTWLVIVIILAVLLLVGGGVAAYFLLMQKNTSTTPQQTAPKDVAVVCAAKNPVAASPLLLNSGAETKTAQAYTASAPDQSGVNVTNGATLALGDSTIATSGASSSSDKSSFEGLNAGILAAGAAKITLSCVDVSTTGVGANGLFAYQTDSAITAKGGIVSTSGQFAHGIMASGGGVLTATDITVNTKGANSAPIATDRGGGTITVKRGTYTSSGADSPGVYSTGSINITDAKIIAVASEAAVVEGSNAITLTNSSLSGARKSGVMLLQSGASDAQGINAIFTMTGGSISQAQGPLFFATNTTGTINLTGVNLAATSGTLVKAAADKWGTAGANGGNVTVVASKQTLVGDMAVDAVSVLALSLKDTSSLTGAVNSTKTGKNVAVTLDGTSTWSLSADSYVTTLAGASISGTTVSNITGNSHNLYYKSDSNSNLGGKAYSLLGGGQLLPY